jgi:phenylacetate-CoA ligase
VQLTAVVVQTTPDHAVEKSGRFAAPKEEKRQNGKSIMSKLLDRAYSASPVWLQQLGINVYGWYWARRRLGPVFERTWRAYAERENWSKDHFNDFVEGQLRNQVQRAFREVPFYRKAFGEYGITEDQLRGFGVSDLRKLPLLEKQVVRIDPRALLTQSAAGRRLQAFSTSGTTGTPLRVYWDTEVHQHNIAVREARSLRWAGVSIREPRSVIGGRLVVPRASSRPPFWRYNRWEKQLYFSAFHISPANIQDYVAALNRFRPVSMTGYASANFFLARLIGELGYEVHSPRAIITNSERLDSHMRAVIESVFHSRAFEEYGSVENCALATECEQGQLHVHPDFGFVEILRPDGQPASPGEVGEIVVTGFANFHQIFIRYRIGDLAAWGSEPCPCGRDSLPVLKDLVGRQEDTVIGPDGQETVRFHGLFIGVPGVAEGQVVQESLDRLVVNVVPTSEFSRSDQEAIQARVLTRLGPEVSVQIQLVQAIPREANGKFRAVISRIQRKPALQIQDKGHA